MSKIVELTDNYPSCAVLCESIAAWAISPEMLDELYTEGICNCGTFNQ